MGSEDAVEGGAMRHQVRALTAAFRKRAIVSALVWFVVVATLSAQAPAIRRASIKASAAPAHNGSFQIDVGTDAGWKRVHEVAVDEFYRPKTVPVPVVAGSATKFRLTAVRGGMAHLDAVLLDSQPPSAANGAPAFKLRSADFDVVSVPDSVELLFPATSADSAGVAELTVVGQIEPTLLPTMPLQFPAVNVGTTVSGGSSFYEYELGSQPWRLTLDGSINKEDLAEPFLKETVRNVTGHPQAPTYAWVSNDAHTLYVALDLVSENTLDQGQDYAIVHTKVGGRVQSFKISDDAHRWGVSGFEYTERTAYEHKTFEWAIPLDELLVDDVLPAAVELAFTAYGTLATSTGSQFETDIAYNVLRNEALLVYAFTEVGDSVHVRARRISYDAALTPTIGNELQVSPSAARPSGDLGVHVAAAHDPVNDEYLVAWADDRDGDSDWSIYAISVTGDGSTPNAEFELVAEAASEDFIDPDIVFIPTTGQFMVLYQRNIMSFSNEVEGRLATSAGPVGLSFVVSNATNLQEEPRAAYDPINDQVLVVFRDNRAGGTDDIYGQRLDTDGTPLGGNFAVSDTSNQHKGPSVAFYPNTQRFLVTWCDVL